MKSRPWGDLARYLLHGSMAAMGAATLGLILVSVWPGALRAMADLAGRLLQRLWGGRPSRKLNRIKGHLADLGASGTWFRAVLAGGAAPLGHAALHSGAIAVMHILALKIAAWGMGFPAPWTALALIYALCTFARLAVMVVPPGLALSEVVFFMLAKELLDLSPGHALGYFVVYRAALVIYVAMVLIIGLLSWRGLAAGALDAEQLKRSRDELQEGLGELKSADGE